MLFSLECLLASPQVSSMDREDYLSAMAVIQEKIDREGAPCHPYLSVLAWIGRLRQQDHMVYTRCLAFWKDIEDALFLGHCIQVLHKTLQQCLDTFHEMSPETPRTLCATYPGAVVTITAKMQADSLSVIMEGMETSVLPWCTDAFPACTAWILSDPKREWTRSYSEFYSLCRLLFRNDLYAVSALAAVHSREEDPLPKSMIVKWADAWENEMRLDLLYHPWEEEATLDLTYHPFLPHPFHLLEQFKEDGK